MRKRLARFWVVAGGLAVACGPAMALGFGDTRAQVVLGQPLNLAVPVTLAEGEALGPECVGAEVQSGESRLPPGTVRARITQGRDATEAVLRVVSSVPMDEPVITLTLSAGCPTRITRTLVLLADPPLVMPTVQTAAGPSAAPAGPPGAAPATPSEATATASAPPASPRPPAASSSGQRATRPAAPPRATRTASPRASAPATAAAAEAPRPAPKPAATAAAKPEPAASAGRPRLQLDSPQVSTSPAVAQLAAQAAEMQASAAQLRAGEAEAAASAAQQRMRDMEAELARIRTEAKAQTDALLALRQQIAQDQSQRQQQNWLVPALLAATGLLALTALWLGWRVRQQQQPVAAQREVWWEHGPASVAAPAEEDSEFRASTLRAPARPPLRVPSAPAPLVREQRATGAVGLDSLISPPTVASPVAVTIPPAPPTPREPEGQRAVTVDEQIDLEQQADFFIALGHDESAIDLLMAHLRSTGGGTPLPFLKLLEIHRRRGDHEAYERTRVRFNQRFNSVAPDWNTDPKTGRSLEEYPLVVGRIQHAWATPLDAMAELEALLFRRGTGAELFDLPAYQELLFLYQLARDLHQSGQPDSASDVDVLLPIGGSAQPVPEGTIMLRPEFSAGEAVKLDLDLTPHAPAAAAPAEGAGAQVAEAKPDLEFDLGPDAAKPSQEVRDAWSDDPGERRRE